MEQYIPKAALVAEIEKLISNGQVKLQESQESKDCESYVAWSEHIATCIKILSLIDTLEVKDMSMPLDNGNMPVERWKEACEAASCQSNYRKSKGWTETCDDYFVDGVQWADEHPIKMKGIDLDKELNDFIEEQKAWVKDDRVVEYNNGDSFNHIYDLKTVARHFVEIGLKVSRNYE